MRFFAYLAFGVSGFMLLGMLVTPGEGHGFSAKVLAFAFSVALPAMVGVLLLRRSPGGDRKKRAEAAWDGELLRLAERRGGSLTAAEVVAHADLSLPDAESRLEGLCARGLAEHRVSDEGVIVYRVQRLPSDAEKRAARGLLDD